MITMSFLTKQESHKNSNILFCLEYVKTKVLILAYIWFAKNATYHALGAPELLCSINMHEKVPKSRAPGFLHKSAGGAGKKTIYDTA